MKFSVLALDYDGTIATEGGVHPEVRQAIVALRARGIYVLLVTGRILSDLQAHAGDLRLFDAVVAENGAVLAFPGSQRSQVLGRPPAQRLFDELAKSGVAFTRGECVVEADAVAASQILEAIRKLALPLVIHFNRGRLMVLPQAVSKGTGLREALSALRLSPHNTAAVGDAENDHQMLEVAELGVAVGWGSPALIAEADDIIDGGGPSAVAAYATSLGDRPRLPPERVGRRSLLLGHTPQATPVSLAVRGRNVLIAGAPRSGKSWLAGLLAEQLILQRYALFVIDPEGDYRSLEGLPGVVVADASDSHSHVHDIARTLHHADMSLVLDLSHMASGEKRDYVRALLPRLKEHRRKVGIPHRILVDEAHYFLHDADVVELLDSELAGYTLVTYCASRLHSAVQAAIAAVVLVTREDDPGEIRELAKLSGASALADEWMKVLPNLAVDEAALLPSAEEAGDLLVRFQIAPRLTPHVRHRHKYMDMPVSHGRAFVFTRKGTVAGPRAHSLKEFVEIIGRSPAIVDDHLRRGDVSRWVAGVFGDFELSKQIAELENQVRVGRGRDVTSAVAKLVAERYSTIG